MEFALAIALIVNAISIIILVVRLNVLLDRFEEVLTMFGKQADDPRYKQRRTFT